MALTFTPIEDAAQRRDLVFVPIDSEAPERPVGAREGDRSKSLTSRVGDFASDVVDAVRRGLRGEFASPEAPRSASVFDRPAQSRLVPADTSSSMGAEIDGPGEIIDPAQAAPMVPWQDPPRPPPGRDIKPADSFISNARNPLQAANRLSLGGLDRQTAGALNLVGAPLDAIARALGGDYWENPGRQIMETADVFSRRGQARAGAANLDSMSPVGQTVSQALSGLQTQGPLLGAAGGVAALARTPRALANIARGVTYPMGAQAGLETIDEGAREGSSYAGSVLGGIGTAATEVLTERTPLGYLLKNVGVRPFARVLGSFMGQELTQEQLAEHIGDAIRLATVQPEKTLGEYLRERPQSALDTLAVTALLAPALAGAARSGSGIVSRVQYGSDGAAAIAKARAQLAERREARQAQMAEISRRLESGESAFSAAGQGRPRPGERAVPVTPGAAAPAVRPEARLPVDSGLDEEMQVPYEGGQPEQISVARPEPGLIEVPGREEAPPQDDYSGTVGGTLLRTQREGIDLEDRRREEDAADRSPPLRSSYEAAIDRYGIDRSPDYEGALEEAGVTQEDRAQSDDDVVLSQMEPRRANRAIAAFVDDIERRGGQSFRSRYGVSKPEMVRRIADVERLAKAGAPAANWYEETAAGLLGMFRGDRQAADTFAQILAITSANTEVKANWSLALKALMQFYRGKPINVKSRADNEKLNSVLYDGVAWDGRKTNAFYQEMSRLIAGRERAPGADSVQDMHMGQAFFRTNQPSKRQYDFGDAVTKMIADKRGWSAQQGQAAIWVGKKADSLYQRWSGKKAAAGKGGPPSKYAGYSDARLRKEAFEEAKIHYGHLADRLGWFPLPDDFVMPSMEERRSAGSQMFAETRPTTKTESGREIAKQSQSRQREFQRAALNAIGGVRGFYEAFGLTRASARAVPGSGGYESDGAYVTAPNVIVTARADKNTVEAMARAWMYVFRQDAVPYYRPRPDLKDNETYTLGVRLTFTDSISGKVMGEFVDRLRELVGESQGFSQVSEREIEIANFGGMDDAEFYASVDILAQEYHDNGTITSAEAFGAEGDYIEHDWQADQSAEGLVRAIGEAGFEGVLGRLANWQRRVDSVAERFASGGSIRQSERADPFAAKRKEPTAKPEKLAGEERTPDMFSVQEGFRLDEGLLEESEELPDLLPQASVDAYMDAVDMWQDLALSEDLFRYPIVKSRDLESIVRQIDPGFKLHNKYSEKGESGVVDYQSWAIEMPNLDVAFLTQEGNEVYIDVGALSSGSSRGSAIYQIAATYAHNNGLVFIGDPGGITEKGEVRRAEHLLASAIKFGTTDHLLPHENMGLAWREGDHRHNIAALTQRTFENTMAQVPEVDTIVYNQKKQRFEDVANGSVYTDKDFDELARRRRAGNRSTSGSTTIKRAALVNTVLREAGGEVSTGRPGLVRGNGRNNAARPSKLPRGLEGISYARESGAGIYSGTSVTAGTKNHSAKVDLVPAFVAGKARQFTAPQRTAVAAAVSDVVSAGMPRSIVDSVDGWSAMSNPSIGQRAAFMPDSGTHVVMIDPAHVGLESSAPMLRWWVAHEAAHHLDIPTVETMISAASPRLAYRVMPNGHVPADSMGDLMAEVVSAVHGNADVAAFLSYPLAMIDTMPKRTFKAEIFAQASTLYLMRPDLTKSLMPRWHAALEDVYGSQKTEGSEGSAGITLEGAREKLRAALWLPGSGWAREGGGVRGTVRVGETGAGNIPRAGRGGGGSGVAVGGSGGQGGRPGNTNTGGTGGRGGGDSGLTPGLPPGAPQAPTPIAGAPMPGTLGARWESTIRTFQDKLIDTKRVQSEIAKTNKIAEAADPYLKEELYHGRVSDRVAAAWRDMFEPLLKRAASAGLTVSEVDRFLWARHAKERNEQMAKINPGPNNDGLSGMTDAQAAQVMADFRASGKIGDLMAIGRMVDQITAAGRKVIVSEGLEPKSTIDAWEGAYKSYVPLFRDEDEPGAGSGFSVSGAESKRATGSRREAKHILAQVFAQHERILHRAERNRIGVALYHLAMNNPNQNFWRVDRPDRKRHVDPRSGLVVESVDPLYKSADNVVMLKIDGVEHSITFNKYNDRALMMARGLRNLDAARLAWGMQHWARVTRTMANLATQWNPVFWTTNFARDIQTALANMSDTEIDGHRMAMMKNVPAAMRGMYRALRNKGSVGRGTSGVDWTAAAAEFKSQGGMTGYAQMFDDIIDREKEIAREVKALSRSGANPMRLGRAFFDWVSAVNGAVENALRLASYVEAKKAGLSEGKSASLAKNLTVNFNRKGNASTIVNAFYMFTNANVQGNVRMFAALARSRKLQAAVAVSAIIGFLLDIINRAVAGEDEDGNNMYDILSDTIKERNWIFMLPNGEHFKIPLPYGFHVFPNAGRLISAALWDTRPQADGLDHAWSFMQTVFDSFVPVAGGSRTLMQAISPTIADPFAQWAENKSWTGAPIRREQSPFGKEVPEYRLVQRKDSEFAKAASKWMNDVTGGDDVRPGWFNKQPSWFDHIVRSATLGTGTTISQFADLGIKGALGEEVSPNQVPFANRFYGEVDDQIRSREFWDRYSRAKKLLDQAEDYRKSGREERAREIVDENRQLIDMAHGYKAARKEMSGLRKEREAVEFGDQELADRREAFHEIEKRRTDILRRVMRESRP